MSTTNSSATQRVSSSSVNGSLRSGSSVSSSNSALKTGLKRDRDTFSSELEQDISKRHLRSTSNSTFSERKAANSQTYCSELEKKVRERDQRLDLLEKDRRWLHDRETEERQAREREGKEAGERETQLKRELSDARISLSNLEVLHADLKDSYAKLDRERQHEVSLLKTQLEEVKKQALFLEIRVEEEKNAAKARTTSSTDLPSIASAPSLSQSTSSSPDADQRLLTAELKRQATYLRQLESTNTQLSAELVVLKSENVTLRERNATVEVLREDKRGLESRLNMKEAEIEKLVRKTEELRRSSVSRRSSSGQLPLNPSTLAIHLNLDRNDSDYPEQKGSLHPTVQATSDLASLRREHAALLDAHGSILAELTAVKRQRDVLQEGSRAKMPEIQDAMQSERVEHSSLQIRLRLKEDELKTALKELTFLEAAVTQLTSDSKPQSQTDPIAVASVNEARVQHLEGLLSDAKQTNADLRTEIENLLEKLKRSKEREATVEDKLRKQVKEAQQNGQQANRLALADLAKLKMECEREKEKREELEKTLDTVEQNLFDLQGEVAGGRHIPPNTRVLEMKDNPHAIWEAGRTAVLERLKGENQALLNRLAEVEEALKEVDLVKIQGESPLPSGEAGSTLVPRESLDLVVKEKEELEDILKQKEKRLLRLQQVFKAKSGEFREAIESIMGVKLAFYPNGQVRVTSLYDLNASFVFGPDKTVKTNSLTDGMNMQLVATGEGGPQDLPNMMRYWIENEACIPGFLASITLECYEGSKKKSDS